MLQQYEANPYPRWINSPAPATASSFNALMRLTFPLASFDPLRDDSRPEILVAGCGTSAPPGVSGVPLC